MSPPTPPPAASLLRLLHLEDAEMDHALIAAQLRRAGVQAEIHRVETLEEFEAALALGPWDAILSDYNLPGATGLDALALLRERDAALPFILVSGQIGEDTAVAAMRSGASDYLLKQNLARLAPALLHALEVGRAKRARDEAVEELAQSRRRLQELAGHLQTRIEAERAAIAREIHDDVGGTLTALKFDLAWMGRHAGNPAVTQRAQEALETITHAIEASQRIMHNLRPAILEQGLVAAVQWMAQRFECRMHLITRLRTSHEQMHLPPGVPLVAYRMAQEALTNVSKHAGAQQVWIDLSMESGVLTLEVRDDGRGLSQADLAKQKSFGLRGLHERAATVGGWIDLSSSPRGTSVILTVPLDEAPGALHTGTGDALHDPSAWGDL